MVGNQSSGIPKIHGDGNMSEKKKVVKVEIDAEQLAVADHNAQMLYAYMTGLNDGNAKLSGSGFAERARQLFSFIRDLKENSK